MLLVNDNLLINEAHIVKAEFSKNEAGQILILLLAVGVADKEQSPCELVLEVRDPFCAWNAGRCHRSPSR